MGGSAVGVGDGAVCQREVIVNDPLITLRLYLTQSELSSLLMGQITQARHSRQNLGVDHPVTRTDRVVLEKLVSAQRQALEEAAGRAPFA